MAILRYFLCLIVLVISSESVHAESQMHPPRMHSIPPFDSIIYRLNQGGWVEAGKLLPKYSGDKMVELYFTVPSDTGTVVTGIWHFTYEDATERLLTHKYIHQGDDPIINDSFVYDQMGRIQTEHREFWGSRIKDGEWAVHWTRSSDHFYDEKNRLLYVGVDTLILYAYDSIDRIKSIVHRGFDGMNYYDSVREDWIYHNSNFLTHIIHNEYSLEKQKWAVVSSYEFYGTLEGDPTADVNVDIAPDHKIPTGVQRFAAGAVENIVSQQVDVQLSLAVSQEIKLNLDAMALSIGEGNVFRLNFFSAVDGLFHDTLIVSVEWGEKVHRIPLSVQFGAASVEKDDTTQHLRLAGNQLHLGSEARDLVIHDITGRLVLQNTDPQESIDLSGLPRNQIYMISVMLSSGERVGKKIVL